MKNLEKTVKLLEYIEKQPASTQRELMNKLGISLGKVNFLVTALAEKGIIKLKRFRTSRNKKGYLYMITPKGIKEKARITREFLKRKIEEYARLKEEIDRLKLAIENNKEELD